MRFHWRVTELLSMLAVRVFSLLSAALIKPQVWALMITGYAHGRHQGLDHATAKSCVKLARASAELFAGISRSVSNTLLQTEQVREETVVVDGPVWYGKPGGKA